MKKLTYHARRILGTLCRLPPSWYAVLDDRDAVYAVPLEQRGLVEELDNDAGGFRATDDGREAWKQWTTPPAAMPGRLRDADDAQCSVGGMAVDLGVMGSSVPNDEPPAKWIEPNELTLWTSTFATMDDARRFLEWAQEPGQILSDWDMQRLQQAKQLVAADA